jgi:hypothetical protein
MPLEGFSQLGYLAEKISAVFGHTLELVQKRTRLRVVADGCIQKILHGVPLQDGKQVLLLERGKELQLVSQIRKQPLAGLGCAVGGGKELLKELIRLIGRSLAEMSRSHHISL